MDALEMGRRKKRRGERRGLRSESPSRQANTMAYARIRDAARGQISRLQCNHVRVSPRYVKGLAAILALTVFFDSHLSPSMSTLKKLTVAKFAVCIKTQHRAHETEKAPA